MARVNRGPDVGRVVTFGQFCNDWFMVEPLDPDEPPLSWCVVGADHLTLVGDEIQRVLDAIEANETGILLDLFELHYSAPDIAGFQRRDPPRDPRPRSQWRSPTYRPRARPS